MKVYIMEFLQPVVIACYADAVYATAESVRPSVRLSVLPLHYHVLSRRMKLQSCGFHHHIAKINILSSEVNIVGKFVGDKP